MKRILFTMVLGALMVPATISGAKAAEAQIESFKGFWCKANGKWLLPKFGNIFGILYTDLPAQREECHAAITRRIAVCGQNTRFASNTTNQKYPECLPIFEIHARACEEFFSAQRPKCDK